MEMRWGSVGGGGGEGCLVVELVVVRGVLWGCLGGGVGGGGPWGGEGGTCGCRWKKKGLNGKKGKIRCTTRQERHDPRHKTKKENLCEAGVWTNKHPKTHTALYRMKCQKTKMIRRKKTKKDC